MALSSTQQTAHLILTKEADSRFWSTTGFKPGQKLDPSIPTDRAMIPVWNAIYAQVVAEDQAGKLHLTYNHPAVQQGIATAAAADDATAQHLEAAANSSDPAQRDQHLQAAAAAQAQSQRATAQVQQQTQVAPPPAAVVKKAATDAAADPPPANAPTKHHLGHHQAQRAPGQVADGNKPTASPSIPPGYPPGELAAARAEAPQMAAALAASPFVFYERAPGAPHGTVAPLASHDALVDWYNTHVTSPDVRGVYVAAFDKNDPSWPSPLADGLGGEAALIVSAHPDAPQPDPWANTAVTAAPIAPPPVVIVPPPPPHRHGHPNVPAAPALEPPPTPKPASPGLSRLLVIAAGLAGGAALLYFIFRETDRHGAGATRQVRALPAPAARGNALGRELARVPANRRLR